MTQPALSRLTSAVGLTLGLALVCLAPTRAAIVVADFDPAYGPAIPNLGFKGTASFFVNDACLAQTGVVSNFDPCSNSTMSVLSAQVDFYNLTAPNTTIASVNYAANAFAVFGAAISGGVVEGVDTNISQAAPVTISSVGPNPIDFSGFMSLYFFTGFNDLRAPSANLADVNAAQPVAGIGGAGLFANCLSISNINCGAFDSQSGVASVTYTTTVPEPTAPALVLIALVGAALARRRKA